MLMAVDNGYQACLMAPTEILAQQHFTTISKELAEMDINVNILTGSKKTKARRELLEETGIEEIHFVEDFVERSEYTYRHRGKVNTKQVYWYLAETERITVTLSHEHRGHMWLDWDQAEDQLTHAETRKILQNARVHMRSLGKE